MLRIIKNFSGASIGEYKIKGNKIFTKLREEAISSVDGYSHDYNWHFVFGVENTEKSPLEVELFIGCADSEKDDLPIQNGLLFFNNLPNEGFKICKFESRSDLGKLYYARFNLSGHQVVYISNFYFRQYEALKDLFYRIAKSGNAKKEVFGQSVEERELIYYKYSNYTKELSSVKNKPAVLITSGFHPPEPDTLATQAIMEYLATEQGKEKIEHFDIYVIPLMNPDGFVHGFNGCNAKQINFYWNFNEQNKKDCPEAFYLWSLAEEIMPTVYFDFHGYTFQLQRKNASPYLKPLLFYEGRRTRSIAKSIHNKLVGRCNGYFNKGFLAYTPSTLGFKLISKFNTLTFSKFHLHLMDGVSECKKLGLDALKLTLETLREYRIDDRSILLKKPFGKISVNPVFKIMRLIKVFWGREVRPILVNFKRKLRL